MDNPCRRAFHSPTRVEECGSQKPLLPLFTQPLCLVCVWGGWLLGWAVVACKTWHI